MKTKTNMKNQIKMTVTLPFILFVNDYHEFYGLDKMLSFVVNKKIKYYELGGEDDDVQGWSAVFYSGKRPTKKEIESLKKFIK